MINVPRFCRALLMAAMASTGFLASGVQAAEKAEAHFVVRDRVIAPDPGAFTATITGIGNGGRMLRNGSGFEPAIYRTSFTVTESAANRIIAGQAALSNFDSLRSGTLDGASVQVLRLENRAFRLIRRDTVRDGGSHASGWVNALPFKRVIPGKATRHVFDWDRWNRPDAPYHFMLRAVSSTGEVSPPSNPIAVRSPAKLRKQPGKPARLIKFEAGEEGIFTALSGDLTAPTNLRAKVKANGRLSLQWDAADGDVVGYILYRSDLPPEEHRGFYLDLAGEGEALRTGDLVILSKRFTTTSRLKYHTNRVWKAEKASGLFRPSMLDFFPDEDPNRTWRLAAHPADTPVSEPGETFLELTLGPRAKARIGMATNSGLAQEFLPVLDPDATYRMEAWMKADTPMGVRFALGGFHGKQPNKVPPARFEVTENWEKYTIEFSPKALAPGKAPGQMHLSAMGPGTLSVDNFRVYRADAPYLDLLPEQYEWLAASGMSALRTHAFVKTRRSTYDLAQLTDPGGLPSGTQSQNSLPQTLAVVERAGMNPWLQVEMHFTPQEWLGLVEYLAAPFDPAVDDATSKPWAAKRHAQGRTAPWTEAFDRIYFELANETWNRLFAPWTFRPMTDAATGANLRRGAVYGAFQEYVLGILRQSPHWPALEGKLTTVVGGWEARKFGRDAAANSPGTDILSVGAYIGGWEAKEANTGETPEDFFRLLTHVLQWGRPVARRHAAEAREIATKRGHPLTLGTYEAGPGYALNGLNGAKISAEEAAAQERVMKSLASGSATLDAFLMRAVEGFSLQNFFTFGPGPRWRSHAVAHRGVHAHPPWTLLSLFNTAALGDFLEVETREVPRADLPEARRRQAVEDAPLIGAYATRQGDRMALILISRQVPGYPRRGSSGESRVRVDLPFSRVSGIRRFEMTGDYDTHTLEAEAVRVVETELPGGDVAGFTIENLRPGETLIYVFDGVAR